jgi:hypothetical protein
MRFKGMNWGRITKGLWIGLCLQILLLGLGSYLADPYNAMAENSLLAFMSVLSFPAGIVPFLIFEIRKNTTTTPFAPHPSFR